MVAFSVYDTKPVQFIPTATLSSKWIEMKKQVYDKVINQCIEIEFLKTNIHKNTIME